MKDRNVFACKTDQDLDEQMFVSSSLFKTQIKGF